MRRKRKTKKKKPAANKMSGPQIKSDSKYDDYDYPTTAPEVKSGHPGHTTPEQDAQVFQLRTQLEQAGYTERLDTLSMVCIYTDSRSDQRYLFTFFHSPPLFFFLEKLLAPDNFSSNGNSSDFYEPESSMLSWQRLCW